MTTTRTSQRGFTIIELMVAVAIIAILAMIVVPTFIRESRKAKADTEINAMFTEIGIKEEQYKSESSGGQYRAATTACPSTPNTDGVDFSTTCVTTGSPWADLRILATDTKIRCSYAVTTGAAGDTLAAPTGFSVANQPAGAWYYIVATCDMDGQGGTNAQFFRTSVDNVIQKYNYGK
jgi:prepilin-type N-terminal cleavage/methylation domain-containing protein